MTIFDLQLFLKIDTWTLLLKLDNNEISELRKHQLSLSLKYLMKYNKLKGAITLDINKYSMFLRR